MKGTACPAHESHASSVHSQTPLAARQGISSRVHECLWLISWLLTSHHCADCCCRRRHRRTPQVLRTFDLAKRSLGEILSAFELMDKVGATWRSLTDSCPPPAFSAHTDCERTGKASVDVACAVPGTRVRNPLSGASGGGGGAAHPFYVLVETSGSDAEHDTAKVTSRRPGGRR
jgi:hypothetical protein